MIEVADKVTAGAQIALIRRKAEEARSGSRPDVARELSIAITALEDAEMRLTRAAIRQKQHKADAERALVRESDALLSSEDLTAPDEAGEAPDSEAKEVG